MNIRILWTTLDLVELYYSGLSLRQFSLYKGANRFVRELITIDSRGGQRLGER